MLTRPSESKNVKQPNDVHKTPTYQTTEMHYEWRFDGRYRRERLPLEQWCVLIRDAHPAYIAW